ncbi:MAG: hypothetical protein V3U87_12555 [Methylococcaceae bacterium]
MSLEFLEYLFGGALYLVSENFREKKKLQWSKLGQMYEIGMWVSIPFISVLVITIALVT